MRDIVSLACNECKRRNYSTTRNKKKTTERLEMKKYLSLVPDAHRAQGDEIAGAGAGGRRLGSRTPARGFGP